ncbi:MAG: 23S rRNA (guanosine(2251)-2'-O)-methyltransferase RlmB [bacterium]
MGKPTREYIYGINPVFEVVLAGRRKIYTAYFNKKTKENSRIEKLTKILETHAVPVEEVSKERLFELCRSKKHQDVVLKTTPYPYVSFDTMLGVRRMLLLDNVEDPHNVGAILRSADIFGYHEVALSLKGVPDIYPSVVKVSAGASEYLKVAKDRNANAYVKKAQENGYTVVALDGAGDTEISSLNFKKDENILLVVGGEDKSVGQFILKKADHIVRIPQKGRINSLNASVAAGIAMFRL